MCGISGLVDPGRAQDDAGLHRLAGAMNDSIRHRGPDHGAEWADPAAGVALAHRRLAIVDLSPAGEQPMLSADGRFVIVYNGEVYNAENLRLDLPGVNWRGHSDTEVMLEGMARWGVHATARRLIGMFALALWDRKDRTLTLVRDRLGIKPVYWTLQNGVFAFASELKALRRHPGLAFTVDRDALGSYLQFGYVPGPRTIYENVHKLQPGEILELPWGGTPKIASFWTLSDVVANARRDPVDPADPDAAAEALEILLKDAVRRRMIADVPLGAFLSGGIDSSLVTALMQAQSSRPVRTFSIGFSERGYDEAPFAKAVAAHLGTEHTELRVTERDALNLIPQLPFFYDEPFADASQIPTLLLSKLTRRDVTVALSGDGGDELFAGYTRYQLSRRFSSALGSTPLPLRRFASAAVRSVPTGVYDRAAALLPVARRPAMAGDRAHKLASVLALPDQKAIYRRLVSQWPEPSLLMHGRSPPPGAFEEAWSAAPVDDPVERMQYADTLTYLPDDILTKVDRASMAVALEARVPLLDHRVVAFAWGLPMSMKIRDGQTKWLLRQVLYRHVPPALVERPKAGFGVPLEHWLRGELRDWAEDLLDPAAMREQGYLDPAPVRKAWDDHVSGRRNMQYPLWTTLMFQAWLRQWPEVGDNRPRDAGWRGPDPTPRRETTPG